MKRLLGCVIVAVGISVLSVAPSANARMGGAGGPIQQGAPNHWGGDHGGGFHDGGRFDHDRFHHHDGDFFFFGAFPFWYPYYGSPYYYDYPPPYYYDDGYYYTPRYYYDSDPSVSYYGDRTATYPAYDGRSYLVLGHDSGKALKKKTVSWNWFIEYLQAYIVNAPSWSRDDFRRGFVSGYGDGAESVFRKGFQQARQPSASPAESQSSSGPNPDSSQRY
jgi:hypothetical protein